MIVWRIIGDEVGPNGNGAMYCATRAEADDVRYAHLQHNVWSRVTMPERLSIRTARELADALNDAMGYGAS